MNLFRFREIWSENYKDWVGHGHYYQLKSDVLESEIVELIVYQIQKEIYWIRFSDRDILGENLFRFIQS